MMKTLFIILLLFSNLTTITAQDLKKKSETKGNFVEVFYIDKETDLMCGEYFKIDKTSKDTVVIGKYKSAMRYGKWVFRDLKTNQTYIEYDFTKDTLLFLAENYCDSFLVKVNNEFIYTKVERPLIFIGYKDEEKNIMADNIEVPFEVINSQQSGFSILSFYIDEFGNLLGSKVVSSFNKAVEQQLNSVFNSFNGRFLPAILNGVAIPSMVYVKLNILNNTENDLTAQKEYPYIYNINLHMQPMNEKKTRLGYEKKIIKYSGPPGR